MRLLLINTTRKRFVSQTVFPNLGLAYIAEYIRKYMPELKMKIVSISGDRDINSVLKDFSPHIVGISSVSHNFNMVTEIGKKCKEANLPVFVGGIHISSLPESLPRMIDFGVIGEGEQTVLEILNLFQKHKKFDLEGLKKIKGIVFRNEDDSFILTERRNLIYPLDNIPFPSRDLLDIQRKGFVHLLSSRGCFYRCEFCASNIIWNKVRFFSAEYVFNELLEIINKYKPKAITFYDDDFLLDLKRFRKIVSLVEKHGMNKKVEFNIVCRSNMINEETIYLMKKMNVVVVSIGFESGCQRILNYLKKGTITVEQNKKSIEMLARNKILSYGFFIIGSPDESEEEILQTLKFIKSSRLNGFSVYSLTPYPGTPIWDYCLKNNLVSSNMDWNRLALNIHEAENDIIVISQKLSKERLCSLYRLFQKERKKRHLSFMIKRLLRHPSLAIPRISRSIKCRLDNIFS